MVVKAGFRSVRWPGWGRVKINLAQKKTSDRDRVIVKSARALLKLMNGFFFLVLTLVGFGVGVKSFVMERGIEAIELKKDTRLFVNQKTSRSRTESSR